ncbi:unnamed protein product, partial [marine sediment metagenome]
FTKMEFKELVQGIKNIVEELRKLNSKIDKLDIKKKD